MRINKKKIKRKLKEIDGKIFKGKLAVVYKNTRKVISEPFYNIEGYLYRKYRSGKILYDGDVALKDIILSQYHDSDFENYRFVNGVVELLAIENWYGCNEYGFDMYSHMQEKSGFDWSIRFKNLIQSYEENGYDDRHFVQLAKDFAVMDGSHRIMLGWYNNLEFINAKVYQTERDRVFNWDFFWERGFSIDECNLLKQRRDLLLKSANYDFVGVVWPPAVGVADEIISDIEMHGEGIEVVSVQDLCFEKEGFVGLFKGLYHTDVLDEDGMEYKLGLMDSCMENKDGLYPIKVVTFRCDNPRISMNPKNATPQSQTISRIKTWVRRRYENKVYNYQYDVILHIADNYLQSTFCKLLFEINRDIHEAFEEIKNHKYALMRIKNSSQHTKFPYDFYYKSNVNMLVDEKELDEVEEKLYQFSTKHFQYHWMSVSKVKEGNVRCIKIWLRDFLIFQFELVSFPNGLNSKFASESLSKVVDESVYKVLPKEYEVIVRFAEYVYKPQKEQHLKYVIENKEYLDYGLLKECVDHRCLSTRKIENALRKINQK